jgi:hypothetical protein
MTQPAPNRFASLSAARGLCLLIGAGLVLSILSVAVCGAGFIHPESYSFLPHYLSGRPFLELIFDNRATEWGNYQARELAFVFDWFDAHFIQWCVQHGHPHFFSFSHYGFVFFAGLILWRICVVHLALPPLTSLAFVLLLWTGPTAMLYTSFYRSAKAGCLFAVLLTILAWLHARRSGSLLAAAWLAVSATLMPLFDKQGFIFLAWLVMGLLWQFLRHRRAVEVRLFTAGMVAFAFALVYQRALGPWLAWKFAGIPLNLGYASLPFGRLLRDPGATLAIAGGSVLMAYDSFRVPLGNLSFGLGLIVLWWIWRQYRRPPIPGTPSPSNGGPFLLMVMAICGLFGVMLAIFPQMNSTEHRRFFYGFPVLGIWLTVAAGAVAIASRRRPRSRGWMEAALLALVAGNLFAVQEHRFILRHGKYAPYVVNASRVLAAVRFASTDEPSISPLEAALLLPHAGYFPDAVPPSLKEDRIYLLFRSRSGETATHIK